jgi:hypothetical protein
MTIVLSGTNGIQNVLGSAAAPAESNTTNSNTGMYFPTSTTLGFSTAGTNAVYINASQNVGIGNSSPATKLDVSGPASVTSFTGTAKLGVVVRGSTGNTDYSGIDFIGSTAVNPTARIAALSGASGSYLSFGTSNTYASGITNTAMTIDYSGNVSIGSTSSNGRLYVVATGSQGGIFATAVNNHGIYAEATGTGYGIYGRAYNASYGGAIGFDSANTTYGILGYAGYGLYTNASINVNGTVYTSDRRLKENDQNITNALSQVMQLRAVSFDWKADSSRGLQKGGVVSDYGFIAQEVETIMPNLVYSTTTPARPAEMTSQISLEEELGEYKGIDYSRFVPFLTAAIQEQQALITQLTDRIAALEAK